MKNFYLIVLFVIKVGISSAQFCFSPSVSYTVGNSPGSAYCADFNGDTHIDIAVSNDGSANVAVLLGSQSGTFATPAHYTLAAAPTAITGGDYNNDGYMDVAVTTTANNVTVLFGGTTGTLTFAGSYGIPNIALGIHSADFNNDGNIDIATANFSSSNVSILFGSATGTFAPAVNYPVGTLPYSITGADVNGDGNQDLMTSNNSSGNVSILYGSLTGTFSIVNVAVGSVPRSAYAGDFNTDGFMDIACELYGSNAVGVVFGSLTGTFSIPTTYTTGVGPIGLEGADFDQDGITDLVSANYNGSNLSLLKGNVNGTFLPAVTYSAGTQARCVKAADFNQDGNMDFMVTNYGSTTIMVFLNSSPALTVTATQSSVCAGSTVTLTAGGATSYTWTGGITSGTGFVPTITQSYTVTGTSTITNCSSRAIKTISVYPLPLFTVNANDNVICLGESVTLTASGATTYSWTNGTGSAATFTPLVTTTFVVIGYSTAGCTNTVFQSVTVNPLPVVTATVTSPIVCEGESTVLTGLGATSYSWTGGVINGVAFTPAQTLTYTLTGTDAAGCTNTATAIIAVDACVGISATRSEPDQGPEIKMEVFPNPASSDVVIRINSDMDVKIINVEGRAVKSVFIGKDKDCNVSVADVNEGIYFILGNNGAEVITQKLIIIK
jgi:hypothetical protein